MKSSKPPADPIASMLAEQAEIESSVSQSFEALDELRRELTAWQDELTRREAVLEARQGDEKAEHGSIDRLARQLGDAQEELRQLEAENLDQLVALEAVERQHAMLQAELRVERKRAQELVVLLDAERARSAEEHRQWTSELRGIRQTLERQSAVIEDLAPDLPATLSVIDVENDPGFDHTESTGFERSAELRRRALSRRAAAKDRQQRDYG